MKDQQDFTKSENERNRDLQKEIQMNLQLLTGKQNENQLKDNAKIQVKCGGSMKRKHKERGGFPSVTPFENNSDYNLPFRITDGGGAVHRGITSQGYDLYELVGDDHEHYHKAQGGKNKTGVGITFPGGKVIEGEGNQNTSQGEYMLVTPNDAKFISKHTIKGINPAQLVNEGLDPMIAFYIQEGIKNKYNIPDSGEKAKHSVNRNTNAYGGASDINITPDLSLDFLAPVATGIVAGTRDTNQAKNGTSLKNSNTRKKLEGGGYSGAWWNAVGNLAGAGINWLGNSIGGKKLSNAYSDASDTLANAFNSLKTINLNDIKREDYAAAHAMAALQAPIINTGAEKAAAERSLQRNLNTINRGTSSAAAAQDRIAKAEIDYNDKISGIESNANRLKQGIIQNNMNRITQVSSENANRDTAANQAYANAKLNVMQYNNAIENQRIMGAAQAKADGLTQSATAIANSRTATANSFANALTNTASGFVNAYDTNQKNKFDLATSSAGWTTDQRKLFFETWGNYLTRHGWTNAEINKLKGKYGTSIKNVIY